MFDTIPAPERSALLKATLEAQRAAYLRDGPPTVVQRKQTLGRLRHLLLDRQDQVAAAIDHDFEAPVRARHAAGRNVPCRGIHQAHKPALELLDEAGAAPRAIPVLARAHLIHQPVGVVGVISP
jgi:coniferyl-aldehyde dehydrogenase